MRHVTTPVSNPKIGITTDNGAAATSSAAASTLVKPSLHATNEPLSLPLSPSLSDAEAENSGATHTSSAAYALANKSCFHGVWLVHRRRILDLVIFMFT